MILKCVCVFATINFRKLYTNLFLVYLRILQVNSVQLWGELEAKYGRSHGLISKPNNFNVHYNA